MYNFLHLTLHCGLAGLRFAFVLIVVGLPAISPLITEVMDSVVEVEACEDCEACVANARENRRHSESDWGAAKNCIDSACRCMAVRRQHSAGDGHRLHNGILAPLRC